VTDEPPTDPKSEPAVESARRLSFGGVAEQYDHHRPGYPEALVDDVLAYAGAEPGDRALEVGAGTGRATVLFASRGLSVTAVEPDPAMAAVASRRAATAGTTFELVPSDFESSELSRHTFKLLFSATAWHWVNADRRNVLAHRALVPGGALAPFWNRPVWEENRLRPSLAAAYGEVEREFAARPAGPMNPFGAPLEIKSDQEWLTEEFRDDPNFADLAVHKYRWVRTYTTAEYVGLIGTHSDHILLPEVASERLFARITDAIKAEGGSFELTYETLLCLARAV
jgi:SAM-dependent methyltransferase